MPQGHVDMEVLVSTCWHKSESQAPRVSKGDKMCHADRTEHNKRIHL